MKRARLDVDDIIARLSDLSGWTTDREKTAITRTFRFAGFGEAFGFMAEAALAAEKLDHHPDWRNVYRTVEVTLTTHDAGGLTELDFALAARMDRIADRRR